MAAAVIAVDEATQEVGVVFVGRKSMAAALGPLLLAFLEEFRANDRGMLPLLPLDGC